MQLFKSLPVSGTTLTGLRMHLAFEPIAQLVCVLFFLGQNSFQHAARGGVLVTNQRNHLMI